MAASPRSGSSKKKTSAGVRARRDFEALAARRRRAADMFARGARQAEVVRQLGVSRQTASEWYGAWAEGGKRALRGTGRAGRRPKLDDKDLAKVERALARGPVANGFATQLWTLARVGDVIEAVTGVRYSTGHVWWILRERLGWSRQRPARRATERDDEAIERWRKDRWPKVKKTPGGGGRGSSSKTKAASRSSRR